MSPYAEVIGDPIAHSLSPTIHLFWLKALGLEGDYRATRVPESGLAGHLAARRVDPDWRGCNVTIPHKRTVVPLLDEVDAEARLIGAVNCIRRDGDRLVGLNSDVDGIAEALAAAALAGGKVAIIGGGGGARAAIHFALAQGAGKVVVLVRNPARAAGLALLATAGTAVEIVPIENAEDDVAGAVAVINASPMGMAQAEIMSPSLLAALASAAPGAVAFDMVYQPRDTPFLQAGRAAGMRPVDGLVMLVGQARKAFELFFGAPPPREKDSELRQLLDAI